MPAPQYRPAQRPPQRPFVVVLAGERATDVLSRAGYPASAVFDFIRANPQKPVVYRGGQPYFRELRAGERLWLPPKRSAMARRRSGALGDAGAPCFTPDGFPGIEDVNGFCTPAAVIPEPPVPAATCIVGFHFDPVLQNCIADQTGQPCTPPGGGNGVISTDGKCVPVSVPVLNRIPSGSAPGDIPPDPSQEQPPPVIDFPVLPFPIEIPENTPSGGTIPTQPSGSQTTGTRPPGTQPSGTQQAGDGSKDDGYGVWPWIALVGGVLVVGYAATR